MQFKSDQPVLRRNFDRSLDFGRVLEVRRCRIVVLLNRGGRETFCLPNTGGWSVYADLQQVATGLPCYAT